TEKNGVKISGVLDSVLQTQVAQLAESMKRKSPAEFQQSYDETLSACNGCHTEAGYKFIHIVRPNAPPVTNQKWETGSNSKKFQTQSSSKKCRRRQPEYYEAGVPAA